MGTKDINFLASGSDDGEVRLWNLSRHNCVWVGRHTDAVYQCTFDSSNNILVTCSEDCSIILWDAMTGEQLDQLFGHEEFVNGFTITNDDRYIVTWSDDQ